MILFGHPGGNPNSFNAALAHFEAGRLAAFCVPWMPSALVLSALSKLPFLRAQVRRFARRRFEPLDGAPKIQGRLSELRRLFIRSQNRGNEGLAYEANDWLMRTMSRACQLKTVTAVHSYEDCSLWQFEEAERRGKARIYDMPIGFYPAWEQEHKRLARHYAEWLPEGGAGINPWVRPEQKRREMELADLVLAPSTFVRDTILRFHPKKKIVIAPYGVDTEFWKAPPNHQSTDMESRDLRFIFSGQCSIRKGLPVLLEAWRKAGFRNATLTLVGTWQLADRIRQNLPVGVTFYGPLSPEKLRDALVSSDVYVCPTFFEGRALGIGEALACGLPVVTTLSSGMTDLVTGLSGFIIPSGNEDALVDSLRWFVNNRERLPAMKAAARASAETSTWEYYRRCVSSAVTTLLT